MSQSTTTSSMSGKSEKIASIAQTLLAKGHQLSDDDLASIQSKTDALMEDQTHEDHDHSHPTLA